ncbi:unnamed protein product [Strongylus vulgaris]|uniref:Dynein light chain n=1 Tax=Strongylus vulgaris TaxID=40348 RepID=A0A3P7JEX7_STRVU|nr:unnamed protein product [Strongylus vulgaris]
MERKSKSRPRANPEKCPPSKSVVVKSTDMSEEMQQEAIAAAQTGIQQYQLEKDIASYIKLEFDKRYSPSWHCVVGRNFGSYVTHETNRFIYFYVQHVAVMLFKTGF